MRNKFLYSVLIILIIVIGFLFITNQNTIISQDENIKSTITLSSYEEIEFLPDKAKIVMGVETRSEKLEKAKNENNKDINNVKKVLDKYNNLEVANISFNVYPVYENNKKNQQNIKYYRVRNILEIKLSNLDLISKIIDDSLNAGANTVYNLQYSLANENEARQKVIEKALISIEDKVNNIKNNLNKKDYKLKNLNVSDNIQGRNLYYDHRKTTLNENSINSTNLEPAKIKISVTLRGEYILSK